MAEKRKLFEYTFPDGHTERLFWDGTLMQIELSRGDHTVSGCFVPGWEPETITSLADLDNDDYSAICFIVARLHGELMDGEARTD